MIKILILCLIFSTSAFASDYIKGEGRFYAQDGDSIQFVKKQLLYNAFRDVLGKELKRQGLNEKGFWENFDQKFEEYFAETKESLKTKYNIVEGEKVKPSVKEKYNKELRQKRLVMRTKFASLKRAVRSYAIKNLTRSPKYPKSRYLRLQAKVDRKILNKIYFRFIKSGEGKRYSAIIISPTISLSNLTWEELGVEVKNDLTEVIFGHWKKWYLENMGESFGDVRVVEGDLLGEIVPSEPKTEEKEDVPDTDEELENEFSNVEEAKADLGTSIYLKVNITLTKEEERPILKKRKIGIVGDGLVINQLTHQILGHFEIRKGSHTFSTEKVDELGSNIASWIYRMPLIEFGKLKKNLTNNISPSKVAYLKVEGITSVQDLFTLNKILEEKGVANQVVSKTKTYNGQEAKIMLFYHGSLEQVEQIVKGVKSLNIKDNKKIDISLLGV